MTLAALGLLLLLGWHFTRPTSRVFDIGLDDETRYLERGLHLANYDVRRIRAPLYSLWYAFLHLFAADPVALYDLNFRVQMTLLPALLFLSLRAGGVPTSAAFVLAWMFMLSDANIEPWPRVAAFSWMWILAGIALFRAVKHPQWRWLPLGLGLMFSTFARPENMGALLLLVLFLAGKALRATPNQRQGWAAVLGAFALSMTAAVLALGFPYEPGRLWVAFGQHFSLRWAREYGDLDPWMQWDEVTRRAFGPHVTTIAQAFLARPELVARHILANARDLVLRLPKMLFSHLPVLLRGHPRWEGLAWMALSGGALLTALGRDFRATRGNTLRAWWRFAAPLLALTLPGWGSALLIYPRLHYLVGVTLVFWVLWGWLVFAVWKFEQPLPGREILFFLVVLAVWWRTPSLLLAQRSFVLTVRPAIEVIRAMHQQGRWNKAVIPATVWVDNLEIYVPAPRGTLLLRTLSSPQQLAKWATQETDLILAPEKRRWLQDPERRAALENLARQGWSVLCTQGPFWLVIRGEPPHIPHGAKRCFGNGE